MTAATGYAKKQPDFDPGKVPGHHRRGNPKSGVIVVAISTSSRVAVLRTPPEMPMSASETRGMLLRQRVRTVTHVVELLNFVQDRIRIHGSRSFPQNLRRENVRWADLVQGT
jgi:hypothetical protein